MNPLLNKYSEIIVNRHGNTSNSFMITTDIINEIYPNKSYQVKLFNGLEYIDNFKVNSNIINGIIPKFIEVNGKWIKDYNFSNVNSHANILGNFGKFEINTTLYNNLIMIPCQVATSDNLLYYDVKLLKINDVISFETNDILPLTIVDVGSDYISDYILNENLGGGIYFEYHKNPHFHMPYNMSSNGYIMFAKKIDDDKYHISAFKIPYGYAIYTPPYVLHNDCFLVGKYYVIYSKSEPFSTCLVRNKNDELIYMKLYE